MIIRNTYLNGQVGNLNDPFFQKHKKKMHHKKTKKIIWKDKDHNTKLIN